MKIHGGTNPEAATGALFPTQTSRSRLFDGIQRKVIVCHWLFLLRLVEAASSPSLLVIALTFGLRMRNSDGAENKPGEQIQWGAQHHKSRSNLSK
jgi:hypothetical protein